MKKISRLLIAYDGSECGDAMLKDLRRAGLPPVVEAVVATIAYVFPPPADQAGSTDVISSPASAMVQPSQLRATRAVENAFAVAKRAADRIKKDFPGWSVIAKADAGAPAWQLVLMANQLKVDLITIGSHGHSTVGGRLILGSVSQRVLYDAACPVRVARCAEGRGDQPIRIVVGFDGSVEAGAALKAVTLRSWPPATEVKAISVGENTSIGVAEKSLLAAGLIASEVKLDGDPATVLAQEAKAWSADSIFVGTRNVHGFQHLLHGSVSASVAARAHCSVEVVRAPLSDE